MNDENDKPKNQPEEDWAMTDPSLKVAPNQTQEDWEITEDASISNQEKTGDGWEMPKPVFRVSSGTDYVPAAPKTQPEFQKSSPEHDARPKSDEPRAQPATAQTTQKKSKLPLVLGGLFLMFSLAAIFLAAVYFLFLKKSEPVQILKPAPQNTASNSNSPNVSNAANFDLPREINYKGEMVLVAAGEFTMGTDDGEDVSRPAHKVTLPAFYIDKYEVTNAQYKEFCEARKKCPLDFLEDNYFRNRPNAPVVGISFADAQEYAQWAGKRLPTEEEWEKAASWDDVTQTKRAFPWGNDFQKENVAFGTETSSDVGKFTSGASFYGAMDMAGNVLEWVDAYFKPYAGNLAENSEFGEKNRVVRGGFFKLNDAEMLKTTKRMYIPPDMASREEAGGKQLVVPIGFRCAVSADDERLKAFLRANSK